MSPHKIPSTPRDTCRQSLKHQSSSYSHLADPRGYILSTGPGELEGLISVLREYAKWPEHQKLRVFNNGNLKKLHNAFKAENQKLQKNEKADIAGIIDNMYELMEVLAIIRRNNTTWVFEDPKPIIELLPLHINVWWTLTTGIQVVPY